MDRGESVVGGAEFSFTMMRRMAVLAFADLIPSRGEDPVRSPCRSTDDGRKVTHAR
jgi:hypothetical protein